MEKAKIAIVGASGYTGFMLLKLLADHPYVDVKYATSRSQVGQKVCDAYPALAAAYPDLVFGADNRINFDDKIDLAFTALPAGVAAAVAGMFYDKNIKVVDLSADLRYTSKALYESTYSIVHPRPDILKKSVYGLCEYERENIKGARVVGNPGCYVTSVLLAIKPLLESGLIDPSEIIADCKSGISGAGRSPELSHLLTESAENFKVYKPLGHRHTTEMEEKSGAIIVFTPHLLPIKRGILSTIYAKTDCDYSDIVNAYSRYASEPFVSFVGDKLPEIRDVRGSNRCVIGAVLDKRCGTLKLVSVLDNIIKGASGQAIQNMNLMLGFDEKTALPIVGEHL